jgi:mRNA interferase MazF
MAEYVPRQGDYIAVTFDPQSGHEQRGRRPALVVSKHLFNKHTGLCRAGQVDRLPFSQSNANREGLGTGT